DQRGGQRGATADKKEGHNGQADQGLVVHRAGPAITDYSVSIIGVLMHPIGYSTFIYALFSTAGVTPSTSNVTAFTRSLDERGLVRYGSPANGWCSLGLV
ncbi:MAG: hypothetical protein AAGH65_08360, partial [Pseudomonadota bacterium]